MYNGKVCVRIYLRISHETTILAVFFFVLFSFFLILCRTVVENSRTAGGNIRRSTFFQWEFKVLTFLHSK